MPKRLPDAAGMILLAVALPACARTLPALRSPEAALAGPPPITAPIVHAMVLPKLEPMPGMAATAIDAAAAALHAALLREVGHTLHWSPTAEAAWIARTRAMLAAAGQTIQTPQIMVVVDRNPAVEELAIVVAQPGRPWWIIGGTHVSTGQSGRKDYYITPVGVFPHTDAILDYRAEGTVNENGVRGLGAQGMRVWDFGWQYALKGWSGNGDGGDIRLEMHATDPELLEGRIGRPASEGCVRIPSALNRFLDRHGVLDADYERAAMDDIRYRALLRPDRTPTPLAGRLLVVIDSRDNPGALPTADGRPADLPPPEG